MYRTLSSISDHEYTPIKRGPNCGRNPRDTTKCNMLGCIRCQPSCEICGLYHPAVQYTADETKPLKFEYSRDNVFTKDYQHYLYHNFEPDRRYPPGHTTGGNTSNNKYCYSMECSLCRPICKHCGKVEKNHSYR